MLAQKGLVPKMILFCFVFFVLELYNFLCWRIGILVEWAAKDSSNSRGEFQFPPSFSMNYQSCLRIMAAGTYRVPQYIFTVFLWCAMMRYRQNRESQLLGCSHTSISEDRGKAKA
ncbi:hypothetical protein Lser_V15G34219 [Lactuca serriola]